MCQLVHVYFSREQYPLQVFFKNLYSDKLSVELYCYEKLGVDFSLCELKGFKKWNTGNYYKYIKINVLGITRTKAGHFKLILTP